MGIYNAKLNDINADLINFYRHSQFCPERLWIDFNEMPRSKKYYYDARSRYNSCSDQYEKAVLFYYINRNCFNGIYRVNRVGAFNVPFSTDRVSRYLTMNEFVRSATVLKDASFSCDDFQSFCRAEVKSGDFVFLDPPYAVGGSKRFHHYNKTSFTSSDFDRLTSTMKELDALGARFLLSFPDVYYAKTLNMWNRTAIQIRRTIAGQVAFRGMAEEMLVYNYDA